MLVNKDFLPRTRLLFFYRPLLLSSPLCRRFAYTDHMTLDTLKDIEKLEADLWEAADNLRANSKLTSSDYFMPVLGMIFLRHAANRFEAATKQIHEIKLREDAETAAGKRGLREQASALAAGAGALRRDHG